NSGRVRLAGSPLSNRTGALGTSGKSSHAFYSQNNSTNCDNRCNCSRSATILQQSHISARLICMVYGSLDPRSPFRRFVQCLFNSLVDIAVQSNTAINRHSPDDSEISVESSDFAASLEARREMWLATSSSGSPNDG